MKVLLKLISLALVGATAGVHAHELRGGTAALADVAAAATAKKVVADVAAAATGKKLDFFPDEMDEESEDRNPNKRSAAQKRQSQRDARREYDNPNRSQHEERRERERKTSQSKRRGNRCVDPSDPGCGRRDYPRERENNRQRGCNGSGRGCNYHRVGRDPNPRRREADNRCIRNCRSVSCERKCSELQNVEDVEYIANFLENMDVDFIADFLEDVAYGEDFEDSYDEDESHSSQDYATS
eukprot:CAMPEP_0201871774 /NCGR_PEP_ID=MMETSP0902-20130614/4616_1 /ASSEMBLY_ACC=CAM_ASM_000551 /TAXON_ID=420261 /ORGANISM="Thalassiosira antarctica, Strain CCMP982" /LENGTH=239 /DNA_ID=CAMNT_0048397859 /DNA_START=50 /DNA_END=769 /DNA_ORIENTATION=+